MSSRIIPKISSGKLKLLISETLCFNPLDGLEIRVPTANEQTGKAGKDIVFNFIFEYEKDPQHSRNKINNH